MLLFYAFLCVFILLGVQWHICSESMSVIDSCKRF